MTRKRILIFSLAYEPFIGGAEVALKEITDRLPDQEFEMITANLDGRQEKIERIGNILVRRVANKYLFPFFASRLAVKLHQTKKYDAVWAMMANQAGMAAAMFKKNFPLVPFLLTLQEGDDLGSLSYRLRLLAPRLFGVFRSADQIQVISNYLAAWARRMGARCPITAVPNGVDVNKFKVESEKRKATTQNLKTIITTSRLVWKNGVDILISAMQFLPNNVRLQILGIGPEETFLKQLMSRHRLDSRIQFLGHVAPGEVIGYLTRADIFARPSRSEGLGNSFLEAMAAGLPVIGTPVGGIPDFLHDPYCQGESLPIGMKGDTLGGSKVSPWIQTGWFCEVGNPQSVAEKVKYILNPVNLNQVQMVIRDARELVTQKYDWNGIAQEMAQIIAKLS